MICGDGTRSVDVWHSRCHCCSPLSNVVSTSVLAAEMVGLTSKSQRWRVFDVGGRLSESTFHPLIGSRPVLYRPRRASACCYGTARGCRAGAGRHLSEAVVGGDVEMRPRAAACGHYPSHACPQRCGGRLRGLYRGPHFRLRRTTQSRFERVKVSVRSNDFYDKAVTIAGAPAILQMVL